MVTLACGPSYLGGRGERMACTPEFEASRATQQDPVSQGGKGGRKRKKKRYFNAFLDSAFPCFKIIPTHSLLPLCFHLRNLNKQMNTKILIIVSENSRVFVLLNSESAKCLRCKVTELEPKLVFYLLNVHVLS